MIVCELSYKSANSLLIRRTASGHNATMHNRPIRPLAQCAESGSNLSLTCSSTLNCGERQFFHQANAYSLPTREDIRRLGSWESWDRFMSEACEAVEQNVGKLKIARPYSQLVQPPMLAAIRSVAGVRMPSMRIA
mgnify:CR=1 FL=1